MKTILFFFIFVLAASCSTVSESEDPMLLLDDHSLFLSDDENPDRSPWTLVVIPDTQHYTSNWKKAPYENMEKAFDWIVENKKRLNIKMVQGLGDVTENWDNWHQWERGFAAWSKLRGHMLYMPALGNHDSPEMFNAFFPLSDFDFLPWYGGSQGGSENIFFLMTLGGVDYMFLTIDTYDQYSKHRPDGLNWAKNIVEIYPNRKVILATHDLWSTQTVKKELIEKYANIFLANAGHSCVREEHYKSNNANVFIVDYQCDSSEVFKLRYYTFYPDDNLVKFYTYSPVTGEYENDWNSEGTFQLHQ